MVRFGVLLMIVSIVAFVGIIIAPLASADVRKALEPYVCERGETLEVSVSRYRPGETSYSLYCKGDGTSNGADALLLVSMLGFFALLGISILLIIRGSMNAMGGGSIRISQGGIGRKRYDSGDGSVTVHTATMGSGEWSDDGDPFTFNVTRDGKAHSIQINLTDPSKPMVMHSDGSNLNDDENALSDKLRQLQKAYESGLITQTEYDTKRREMLDQF